MVLINGTQFVVYDLDTQRSILERLATQMRTTPKYLYFPNGVPTIKQFRSNTDIPVEDLLEIVTSDTAGMNFVTIFNQIKDKVQQQELDLLTDLFYPFVAFNKQLEDADEQFRGAFLLVIETEVDQANIFTKRPDVNRIWDKRNDIRKNITGAIQVNDKETQRQLALFQQFEATGATIPFSPFELERVSFEFTLDMTHITIMELFNHIQLEPGVPFATINGFFKILKDFIPSEEWDVYLESAVIFKVLQKKELSGVKIGDYTDAVLSVLGEPGSEVVTVGMSLLTAGQYLSRGELIDRFLGTIKGLGEIKVKTSQESKVNGVFYIPGHQLDKYVFADLAMNNPLFASMMYIDESEKATKKKDSVYIHFHHPETGRVTANITQKVATKGDPDLRGKDIKGAFQLGTHYIRVKISSADNIQAVVAFQNILSRLLVIYDQEYQGIVDFYRIYLPTFGEVPPLPPLTEVKLKLKDIAPEVFVTGYPPKCPHKPTIIGDDEVATAEARGKVVMRYPMDASEGFIPRNYICDHPKAIYPGLRDNPLPNREVVPFLPCCYPVNHEDKEGSIYRHYFHGEDLRAKVNADQQELIITNKFVPKDKYGTLPDDITKLFGVLDPQDGFMYVRKGVHDNKSSFLDCVMEGMHEETNIIDFEDKDEREAQLYQIRDKLSQPRYAASARQEMFDFTIDEVIAATKNPDIYFDPKLFTAMLEDYFNCNIFVFNRTNMRNGQLALPRHIQAYYKTKRRAKCIFVYEHTGSTSDHATYPRCELIVRWKVGGGGEDDVSYFSPYISPVSRGVRGVFNRMRKAYALDLEIPETEFPIQNSKVKLIAQGIDSYGKCRMIRFGYDGETGTLLTNPIQPLALPEAKGWVATKLEQETAIKFAALLKIPISGQSVARDVVKELYGRLGNVKVSIPVEDSIPIDGVPYLDKGVSYPENEISVVESYNAYKKLARYITEYTFWLFSRYLQESSANDTSPQSIARFQKQYIKVVDAFEYGHVGKHFAMDSGVMEGGKLVVKSEETLKRLMYVLRMSLRRSRAKIIAYHTRRVIENYYVDVTDFDQHQFQVVLQGDESVEKWIQEQKTKYHLHNSVQVSNRLPYFFKNTLIDDKIYLAQNTDNLYKAQRIAEVWLQSGYNPGEDPDDIKNHQVSFTLYSYASPTDIRVYKVGGVATPLDINIMGYKVGAHSFFTVLLPL